LLNISAESQIEKHILPVLGVQLSSVLTPDVGWVIAPIGGGTSVAARSHNFGRDIMSILRHWMCRKMGRCGEMEILFM